MIYVGWKADISCFMFRLSRKKKKHSGIYARCTNAVCMTWALTVTVQFLGYIFEWIYNVRGFVKQQLSGVWDFVHAGGNFESHLHKILFSESKTLLWSNITDQLALDSVLVMTDWLTVLSLCVLPLLVSHIPEQNAVSSQGVPAIVLLLTPDCWLIYLKRCPIRRVSPTNHRTLITVTEHTASLELLLLWTLILCWDHDHGFLWRNLFLLQFLNSIQSKRPAVPSLNRGAWTKPGSHSVARHWWCAGAQ